MEKIKIFPVNSARRKLFFKKVALADALNTGGDIDGALLEYQDMLRLNPINNQGIRDILLPALLRANRDDEAEKLLNKYEEDSACRLYRKASLEFRKKGKGEASNLALRNAAENNPYGIKYLSGKKKMPKHLPGAFQMRSE